MGSEGFSPRRFRMFLDGTIRQVYEERGMYRVQFKQVSIQKNAGNRVAVSTEISEGPRFTLGQVQFVGDNLPRAAMLQAANFSSGGVANWTEIMQKIYRAEGRLKRAGYLQAASHPDRILHDDTHVLDVNVSYAMGPLYHFGQVTFSGLSPDLEAKARSVWSMQTGSPFDMAYSGDFVQEFSKSVDLRAFKIATNETGHLGYIVDETVIFAPKGDK